MMEQNMTLRDFITRGQVGEKMLLYLKLNKAGRRQLFEQFGVTRELWVDKVTLSKEDVDCTFYFLTMNPSICVTQLQYDMVRIFKKTCMDNQTPHANETVLLEVFDE